MPKIKLHNYDVVPAMEALASAISWLKPGAVQFRYCQLKNALTPLARDVMEQDNGLIDEFAKYEGEGEARKRVQVTTELPDGRTQTKIDMTDPVEFTRRRKSLMEQESEIDVPILLNFDLHIKNFVKESVAKPPETTVDFSLLMPLIEGSAVTVE